MTIKKTPNMIDGIEIPEGLERLESDKVSPDDHAKQAIIRAARTVEEAFAAIASAITMAGICPPQGVPHVFAAAMGGVIGSLYYGDEPEDVGMRHDLTIKQLADLVSNAVRVNILYRAQQENERRAKNVAEGSAAADVMLSEVLASHATKH